MFCSFTRKVAVGFGSQDEKKERSGFSSPPGRLYFQLRSVIQEETGVRKGNLNRKSIASFYRRTSVHLPLLVMHHDHVPRRFPGAFWYHCIMF